MSRWLWLRSPNQGNWSDIRLVKCSMGILHESFETLTPEGVENVSGSVRILFTYLNSFFCHRYDIKMSHNICVAPDQPAVWSEGYTVSWWLSAQCSFQIRLHKCVQADLALHCLHMTHCPASKGISLLRKVHFYVHTVYWEDVLEGNEWFTFDHFPARFSVLKEFVDVFWLSVQ